jgi:hypothetical protein
MEERSGADHRAVLDGSAASTASLVLSGGPVDIRVRANTAVMAPGSTRFAPAGGNRSFSFTWSDSVVPLSGGTVPFTVEWRSPNGATVTMTRGSLNVVTQTPGVCG